MLFQWTEQPVSGSRNWLAIAKTSEVNKLATAVYGGYIYTSEDFGDTWVERTSAGNRNWSSIGGKTEKLAACVNGGYIYTSEDFGGTWVERTSAGNRNWKKILRSAGGDRLIACNFEGYIYTSEDSGDTWIERTGAGARAWQAITTSADFNKIYVGGWYTYIYFSSDFGDTWTALTNVDADGNTIDCRALATSADGTKVFVGIHLYVVRITTDIGVTWANGDEIYKQWSDLDCSSDGTKLIAATINEYIYMSDDSGATLTQQSDIGTGSWRGATLLNNGLRAAAIKYDGYVYTGDIAATFVDAYPLDATADLKIIAPISVYALTSTPTLPAVNVPVVQSVGVNDLTATATLTAATVRQIHAIGATPLINQPTVTAAAVTMIHAIGVNELVSQPTVTAAAIGQIHIIAANLLNSTPTLLIYAPNSDSIGGINHLALNFSVDNKSSTTFSNFPFTGSCQFNGKTLFINEQGLFEYGGLTDDGTAIVPSLKTGKMDVIQGQNGLIHTNKIKRIFTSKVRVSCDKIGGSLDLNVTADTNTYAYNKAVTHDGVATHNIPIGRGIKYNLLQLELIANGCSKLDIDSIDYEPTAIQRSER